MCDWRKLLRRVKSRPEIEIADKRLAFSIQTPSIEPSYKTAPNQVKLSISQKVQGLWKNFRLQHVLNLVTLTVRRPQHPYLKWCSLIFLHGNFSRLVPRDSNLGHHTYIRVYTHICTHRFVQLYHVYPGTSTGEVRQLWLFGHADYCNFVNF